MVSAPVQFELLVDLLYAAQIVSRNITASLAFLAWDICITFDQEVEYIWKTPGTPWSIRFLYLFLRYFSLFCLIGIQGVARYFTHHLPIHLHTCRRFFLFQSVAVALITIAADIIFMIRVYALYNRKRWVAVVMGGLLTLEITACMIIIPLTLPTVEFNVTCYITLPTHLNVALSLISLVPPITALLFILAKQLISVREGWGKEPLMLLLVRDGTWGVAGLVGVWLINPLVSIAIAKPLAHVGHLWFMSVIPSIGCRVILNMRRLRVRATPEHALTNDIQLTTDIAGFETLEQEAYQMATYESRSTTLPR